MFYEKNNTADIKCYWFVGQTKHSYRNNVLDVNAKQMSWNIHLHTYENK